mmetsp:Transcript_33603/g.78547  ORF Transcript_33603/g.78547 Transcript_33603/m.78547 type:complete len:260 (+) Transcript_33603:272-1051(+)
MTRFPDWIRNSAAFSTLAATLALDTQARTARVGTNMIHLFTTLVGNDVARYKRTLTEPAYNLGGAQDTPTDVLCLQIRKTATPTAADSAAIPEKGRKHRAVRTCGALLNGEERRPTFTIMDRVLGGAPARPAERPATPKPRGLLFDAHLNFEIHPMVPLLHIVVDVPVYVWLTATTSAAFARLLKDHHSCLARGLKDGVAHHLSLNNSRAIVVTLHLARPSCWNVACCNLLAAAALRDLTLLPNCWNLLEPAAGGNLEV